MITVSAFSQSIIETARKDIEKLTSQEFHGRGYYSNGHLRAADYIEQRFRQLGLQPVNEEYSQQFSLDVTTFNPTPLLIINGISLRIGIDFIPVITNVDNRQSEVGALSEQVYGLVIPSKGIDDYGNRDISNRAVTIRDGAPERLKSDTSINDNFFSDYAKIFFAQKNNAGLVLLTKDRLVYDGYNHNWDIPVFIVRDSIIPDIIKTVAFSIKTENKSVSAKNVMAWIPGNGSNDSMIIICGHYDHLGAFNDSIYFPGANDNASGIALMLALADQIKQSALSYPVLFIAFSGEEMGLQGSQQFVQDPPIDISICKFLLNLDMAASGNNGVMALGGTDFPQEFSLLQQVNDSLGLGELRKRTNAPNSDQYPFLKQGVRGFYLYPYVGHQPYHHINDRMETLEWNIFEKMYYLSLSFLRKL